MFYNFQTDCFEEATASLIVYAVYRSRDLKKFKVSPDMWGIIERAVKSVAKRAEDLDVFIEKLKPKLACSTIKPQFAQTILDIIPIEMIALPDGGFVKREEKGKRRFLVDVLAEVDHKIVLENLYKKSSKIILLVRDRIEREKPLEGQFTSFDSDEVKEEIKDIMKEALRNAK